jgi:hypothetical protein
MAILDYQYGDCVLNAIGTGSGQCELSDFGDFVGFGLLNKGTTITKADIADAPAFATALKDLILGRKLHQFTNFYDFTQDTPENEINTSALGIMQNVRDGKPYFGAMFTKNSYFHKKAWAYKSQGKYDSFMYFTKGVLMWNNIDGTKLKGGSVSMIDVQTKRFKQGTDLEMTTMNIQFDQPEEFNTRYTFYTYEQLGVDLNQLDGVIDVTVNVTTPVTAGTTFSLYVANQYNADERFSSLDATANWLIGGAQASATTLSSVVYNSTTDKLVFTVTPALVATDTIAPKLRKGAFSVAEDTDGNFFAGQSAAVTVTA